MTATRSERPIGAQEPRPWHSLVLLEVRYVALHPVILIGVIACLLIARRWAGNGATVWPRESVLLAGVTLPLAAAAFFVGAWRAHRDRRAGMDELLDPLPTPKAMRTLAVLAGGLGAVAWVGLVQAAVFVYLAGGNATGSPIWAEVAGGPLASLAAWTAGVLLGGRSRSGASVPIVFLVLGFFHLLASPDVLLFSTAETGPALSRLALWEPWSIFRVADEAVFRPSALHLLYLLAVTALLGLLAVPSERDRWTSLTTGRTVVAIALIVVAVPLVRAPDQHIDWAVAVEDQTCSSSDQLETCPISLYSSWTDEWRETVMSVAELVPGTPTRIVQRPTNWELGGDPARAPGTLIVGTEWDRDDSGPVRFELAAQAALDAFGLDPGPSACAAFDDGGAAIALWAAAEAQPDGLALLDDAMNSFPASEVLQLRFPSEVRTTVADVYVGVDAADLAIQLTALSTPEIVETVTRRGDELRAGVPVAEVARWFGLTHTVELTDAGRSAPPCR